MSLVKCKNLTTASMLISRDIIRTWLSFTFSNALIIYIHVFSGSAGDSFVFQWKLHAEKVLKILGRSRIASIDITVNLTLFWDWYPVVFTQVTMNHFMFSEGYLLKVNFPLAVVFIIFGLYTVVGNTLVFTVYFLGPFKTLRRTLSFCYVVNLTFADILVGIVVEPLNASVYWTKSEPALFAFYLFAVLSCAPFWTYPLWCWIVTLLSDRRFATVYWWRWSASVHLSSSCGCTRSIFRC